MHGLLKFIKSNLRWLLGGLLLTVFSSFGQTFFISLFSKEIRETFALTDGEFGRIYMVATLASAATLIWAGKLVDRYSVSAVSIVIMSLLATACVCMSIVSSIAMLLVVIYALRLFGQGMMTHTSQTAMGRWYSAERGRAISLTTMGHQVGEATLPSIVLILMVQLGWRETWQVAAVIILLAIPVVYFLMRAERQPNATSVFPNNTDRKSSSINNQSETGVRDWTRSEVLRDPVFWALCIGILAPAFIGTSVFFHQVHLKELKNWSPALFASSFLVLSITTVTFTLLGGWLVDRVNSRRLLPTFLFPMAVGCLIVGIFDGDWVIFAFMFLLGCSYGFSSAVFGTIWPETYGVKNLGSIRAIAIAAMVFASALGPGVTGECIDRGIGFEFQLIVMACYCFAASILMAWVSRTLLARDDSKTFAA